MAWCHSRQSLRQGNQRLYVRCRSSPTQHRISAGQLIWPMRLLVCELIVVAAPHLGKAVPGLTGMELYTPPVTNLPHLSELETGSRHDFLLSLALLLLLRLLRILLLPCTRKCVGERILACLPCAILSFSWRNLAVQDLMLSVSLVGWPRRRSFRWMMSSRSWLVPPIVINIQSFILWSV